MSEAMTAAEARSFKHGESEHSSTILEMTASAKGCACKPYRDWFTLKRWNAQGYRVKSGEHGVRLTTYKTIKYTDDDGKTRQKKIPKRYYAFCRCQVEAVQ